LLNIIAQEYYALVSDLHLPGHLISNFVILSQCAHWKYRQERNKTGQSSPPSVESLLLASVLAFHRSLLEAGQEQLNEPPPVDAAENDLAQRITAKLRRALPGLRIASKWLRTNYRYLRAVSEEGANNENVGLKPFWEAYAAFSRGLGRCFPESRLPKIETTFEEDVDMRGFLPLTADERETDITNASQAADKPADQAHPNVLMLMRIADLLQDARSLVAEEVCSTL
jgi:protein SMG7